MTSVLDNPIETNAREGAVSLRMLDFYANKPWAIYQPKLEEMRDIYFAALQRKLDGESLDIEAIAAKTGRKMDYTRTVEMRDGVAIIPIDGPIFRKANMFMSFSGGTSTEVLAKDFTTALEDPYCTGILFNINSPGGESDGTSEVADMIFKARNRKPIKAYVSNLGASAAYWLASACEELVCADTSMLGSIGVVVGARTDKDPKSITFVSSQSPNKRPDMGTESGRAQMQKLVDDLAGVFVETVARNRDVSTEKVLKEFGAGGLLVGQEAVAAGLADRLGSFEQLVSELSTPQRGGHQPATASASTEGVNAMANEKDAVTTGAGTTPVINPPAQADSPAAPATVNNDEVAQLRAQLVAAETRATTEAAKATAAEATATAAQQETAAVAGRVAMLEKENRTVRFTAIAEKFTGNTEQHVNMLETLATTEGLGEASTQFKFYVESQTAIAEQIRSSGLFRETGRSGAESDQSAFGKVEAKAKELMAADPRLTLAEAIDQVGLAHPDLAAQAVA